MRIKINTWNWVTDKNWIFIHLPVQLFFKFFIPERSCQQHSMFKQVSRLNLMGRKNFLICTVFYVFHIFISQWPSCITHLLIQRTYFNRFLIWSQSWLLRFYCLLSLHVFCCIRQLRVHTWEVYILLKYLFDFYAMF